MSRLLVLLAATIVATRPLDAQSVRGRVLDAETGRAIPDVALELRRGRGLIDRAVSDADGLFRLRARVEADYRIEASHVAYERTGTQLRIGAEEMVVLDLRLARGVVQLEPLTITARARDPRHDATYEGLYARRSDFARVGPRRAVLHTDPEMRRMRAADVLGLFEPRWRRRTWVEIGSGLGDEPGGCRVVYWNGRMIGTRLLAEILVEDTPVASLEGLEFYESPIHAPAVFRDQPPYAWAYRCSVVVLWPRREL